MDMPLKVDLTTTFGLVQKKVRSISFFRKCLFTLRSLGIFSLVLYPFFKISSSSLGILSKIIC